MVTIGQPTIRNGEGTKKVKLNFRIKGEESMIRLQDIADMAGVSRTTVSNVLYGKTKKVSQATIDKVTQLLKEHGYVPNMASMVLNGQGSKLIGFVQGYQSAHGMDAFQDLFVGKLLSVIQREASEKGFYVILIDGSSNEKVIDIASRWDVDGLIILGYPEKQYRDLKKKLNKKMILLDTYPENGYDFYNVGVDDYSGGFQVGNYLRQCGFEKALFLAETGDASDLYRWQGFKQAMEMNAKFCSKSRYIRIDTQKERRLKQYEEMLPQFLQAGALAFSSDYNAIEAMNFFYDKGIKVPEEISIVGYDDSLYAEYVRPRLTTVRQNVEEKGKIAFKILHMLIRGQAVEDYNIKNSVKLIRRESVRETF